MKELSVLEYNHLKEYTKLEGSELGEMCTLLLQIHLYRHFCSDEFRDILDKEMKTQLKNFKEKCKIVTKKVKYTQTIKELEWR